MKKFLFLVFLLAISLTSMKTYAQDVITKKDGSEIQAKVLEVISTEVKYKKFDNQTGPTYSIQKSEVLMVKYENGTKDIFANESSNVPNVTPEKGKSIIGDTFNPMSKGKYFLSPNLAYNYNVDSEFSYAIKTINLSFNIDEGYFVSDNFAITSTIGVNYYKTPSTTSSVAKNKVVTIPGYSATSFIWGAGLRYYIESKYLVGATFLSQKQKDFDAFSLLNFQFGYSFSQSKKFALEPSVNYMMGMDDNSTLKIIALKIGARF